jgi:hypothetical protein
VTEERRISCVLLHNFTFDETLVTELKTTYCVFSRLF